MKRPQRKDGNTTLSLRDLPNGSLARIVKILSPLHNAAETGSSCCAARLEALGLRVGKIVEKVSGMPFHGPVTLLLDGRQIAVGWNISSHVLVVPVKERERAHGRSAERE
ncbi:MAG TPA: FeoA family protein [Synergistales bacterium]|nr:FeoA family protein [Synergistaceae bacterium]HOO86392.1 FeoA family protein [Synergistales bacterium]HPE64748.1 FeoA family protein [Synergistales bacterium]HRV98380.1 FeoA family protein [Aminobacteriaceae bacterium]